MRFVNKIKKLLGIEAGVKGGGVVFFLISSDQKAGHECAFSKAA